MTESYAGVVADAESYRLAIWPGDVRSVYARSAVGLKKLAEALRSQAPIGILIPFEDVRTHAVEGELVPSLKRDLLEAGIIDGGAKLREALAWQVQYPRGPRGAPPSEGGIPAEPGWGVNLPGDPCRKQPRPQLA